MDAMHGFDEFVILVQDSLDEPGTDSTELAARAHLSRFHFDRLVSAAIGEPPGAFRRRVLLERAAHDLVTGNDSVIRIAARAGYTSPDAFARAFARAYGVKPSEYRREVRRDFDLPSRNDIHFHPPGGLRLPAFERTDAMDVLARMFDHHVELTGDIIDRLSQVSDDALDRPIDISVDSIDDHPTLRTLCDKLVRQLEMWVVAVDGGTTIPAGANTPAAMRARLDAAAPAFRVTVVDPVCAGAGGESFVDATCRPPRTFTRAGVLAHVLTFAAVRRTQAVGALAAHGASDLGAGDPMVYVGGIGEDASRIARSFATS
jgi:AraC family transcriptional regulator